MKLKTSVALDEETLTAMRELVGNGQPFEPGMLQYAKIMAYSLPSAAVIYAGFRGIDYAVRKLMGGGGE